MVVRGETLIPGGARYAAAARRAAANGDVPHALAGLHAMHRGDPLAKPIRVPKIIEEMIGSGARSARTA